MMKKGPELFNFQTKCEFLLSRLENVKIVIYSIN